MTTCLRVFESVDSNDRPFAEKPNRSRSRKALRLAVSAIALSLSCLAGPSYAAEGDQAASENLLPEVIVTSQFRQQNVQSTPIAITAVNAAMLDARGQTDIAQVARQAPNVTLSPQGQQNGTGLIAFIRGVGQTDFNYALDPGVGIYVDDVYYPTLTGSLLDLLDLDRVEILRGPQGTLAGKNSIGGAIKLFSAKPTGDGGGSGQITVGSYKRIDVRAVADFAITDGLYARIAGVSKNHNGYVTRLDYGCSHPGSGVPTNNVGRENCTLGTEGGQAFTAGRMMVRWEASPDFEINIIGDLTQDHSEVGAGVLTYANGPSATADGRPFLASTLDPTGNTPVPYDSRFVPYGPNCGDPNGCNNPYLSYSTFLDAMAPSQQLPYKPASVPPIQHLTDYGLSGTIDWNLSDAFQLKSITAWRHYDSSWAQDVDGSPIPSQQLLQTLHHHQWSEEVRLNGSLFDNKLEFTTGGFWFEQGGTLHARVDLNYAGIDFIHGPDTTPSSSKAAFLHAEFHVTDKLNITGGIRYTKDKKTYTYFRSNPDGTVPFREADNLYIPGVPACEFFLGAPTAGPTGNGNTPNCLLTGLYNISDTFKGTRTDWRVAADYQWTDTLMTYAQVGTGYKGGGVDPRPFFGPSAGECSALPAGSTAPCNQLGPFNPETLRSYEVGFKTDILDGHVRLNGALFYNQYNNIILTLSECPGPPCAKPVNAGKAHVKGAELEAEIHPTEAFLIDASVSYLDFHYTSTLPSSNVTLDMITPYTPEWKWAIGAQYDVSLGSSGMLTGRIDGSYQSHIFTAAINAPTNQIDGYFLANAKVTWVPDDQKWAISFEVHNLTDKIYYTSIFDSHNAPSGGTISKGIGMPRTWAMTVKRSF